MNGIRVQRATTLFMAAEVDFWMKYFECWGRSSGLLGTPPPGDLNFFSCKILQGTHTFFMVFCKLKTGV